MKKYDESEDWLPYIISGAAECSSPSLSDTNYGEIMELASMLHDLGIGSQMELAKWLGANYDGELWHFGKKHAKSSLPKPQIKLSDRRLAVAATKRKNKNVSE